MMPPTRRVDILHPPGVCGGPTLLAQPLRVKTSVTPLPLALTASAGRRTLLAARWEMDFLNSADTHVTIAQVAASAGVSPGTASKALNGRGQLRSETRERVWAAARALDFHPNRLASSLLLGRTYMVGVLSSDSFGRFSIPLVLGIEDALGAGQIAVLFCDAHGDHVREQHYVRTLLERRVDGIIVTGRRTDARDPISRRPLPVPVVYAYARSGETADLSLLPDDEQGGRLAGDHLVASGRRRVAHITGPTRFDAVRARERGLRSVLDDGGLPLAAGEAFYGPWSEEWGREATRLVLDAAPDVDAVFCGSDQIARGVADALRELGRRVPGDVALVGFDNWDVFAAASRPPITSVDMNLAELGKLAAQSVLAAMDGQREQGVVRLPCRLVVRESTGFGGLREWPDATPLS